LNKRFSISGSDYDLRFTIYDLPFTISGFGNNKVHHFCVVYLEFEIFDIDPSKGYISVIYSLSDIYTQG